MSSRIPVSALMLVGLLLCSAPASAQVRSGGLALTFDPASVNVAPARRSLFTLTPAEVAPLLQGGATDGLRFFVTGGLNTRGDLGVAVGGGVVKPNFMDNERHALKFDVIWSNAGLCEGCDIFDTVDFNVWQLSFAGAFIYNFSEMDNGWTPFAGGGVVFVRTSFDWDSEIFPGLDFDDSTTNGGIQLQGGLSKARANGKPMGVEARVQYAGGGGFLLLGFFGL